MGEEFIKIITGDFFSQVISKFNMLALRWRTLIGFLVVLIFLAITYRKGIKAIIKNKRRKNNKSCSYFTSAPLGEPSWYSEKGHSTLKRKKLINRICKKIKSRRVVIMGFGGLGKTTVARCLLGKMKKKYKYIGWVNYTGDLQQNLMEQFQYTRKIPKEEAERKKYVERKLEKDPKHTLLFIDNINTEDRYLSVLCGLGISVIATSRLKKLDGFHGFEVKAFSVRDGVRLFQYYFDSKDKWDKRTAKRLVELVNCHTLAIELLAKGYDDFSQGSLQNYYENLKRDGFGFPELCFGVDYDQEDATIARHLKKLFNLSDRSWEEQRILRNIALMPEGVSIPKEVRIWIHAEVNSITKLIKEGWLEDHESSIRMHAIIRMTVRLDEIPSETTDEFTGYLAHSIEEYAVITEGHLIVMPRLEIAYSVLFSGCITQSRMSVDAYNNIASLYRTMGEYDKALNCYKEAFRITSTLSDQSNLDIAKGYDNIGAVYYSMKDFCNALEYQEKALEIRKGVNGCCPSELATSYSNVGGDYSALCNYKKALAYQQKALEIREKELGTAHADTAQSYSCLGTVCRDMEMYEKALHYHLTALYIRQEILDGEHPVLARNYNNIGLDYYVLGDYGEALSNYHKALAIQEKVLGKEHPDTKETYHNIRILKARGNV